MTGFEVRKCPYCPGGIGKSRKTKRLSSTLKRRYYRCLVCDGKWSQDVRESIERRHLRKMN